MLQNDTHVAKKCNKCIILQLFGINRQVAKSVSKKDTNNIFALLLGCVYITDFWGSIAPKCIFLGTLGGFGLPES